MSKSDQGNGEYVPLKAEEDVHFHVFRLQHEISHLPNKEDLSKFANIQIKEREDLFYKVVTQTRWILSFLIASYALAVALAVLFLNLKK